jgi:hypothetical protein
MMREAPNNLVGSAIKNQSLRDLAKGQYQIRIKINPTYGISPTGAFTGFFDR